MVSIVAFQAVDRGSIPRQRNSFARPSIFYDMSNLEKIDHVFILPLAPMSPQPISSMYIITMFGFVAETFSTNASTVSSISSLILNDFLFRQFRIAS